MTRLLTAAFLIPTVWYLCKRAPFPVFLAAVLVLAAVGAWECSAILRRRGAQPFSWLAAAGCLGIVWAFASRRPFVDPLAVLTATAIAATALAMLRRASPEAMLDTSMTTLFPVWSVGLPLAFTVGLRGIPGENGPDLLLLVLVCVTLSDAGAYYVGSALGAHRMAPVISPKKSWEGAAGGLLASVGGAVVAHFWFFQRLPLVQSLVLGTVLCASGVVGDLAESMLKRATGVKDSSALLPGHGGVLDRVDSLLVAAPVLYYYWRVFLVGTI